MDVLEDVQKEHEKETRKLKKVIAELLDLVASLKNLNAELNEKRKQALGNYYETASKLEDALGIIMKLTAQMNHNYENSSLPSSNILITHFSGTIDCICSRVKFSNMHRVFLPTVIIPLLHTIT